MKMRVLIALLIVSVNADAELVTGSGALNDGNSTASGGNVPTQAPEMDVGSALAGVTLLAGLLAVCRPRAR